MTWDYAEGNPFSNSSGNFSRQFKLISEVLENSPRHVFVGRAIQHDATKTPEAVTMPLVSCDPPYYDNIPYADLSDFFYV